MLKNLLFPALCLHCQTAPQTSTHLFCEGCTPYFELRDPSDRFPLKDLNIQVASALEYIGPVKSLVKKLKTGQLPHLAKTAAAFLAAQFYRLGWEVDCIVPVSRPWLRALVHGIDHSHAIAEQLSKTLSAPLYPVLRRKGGEYPQGRLNPEQRASLSKNSFTLRKGEKIADKRVLLIDDVITTGTTLRHAAETLFEGFPAQIYVLTLCR